MKSFIHFCLVVLLLSPSAPLLSQSAAVNKSLWTRVSENQINVSASDRQIVPEKFLTYALDITQVRNLLAQVPTEQQMLEETVPPVYVEFPNPDGSFSTYKIWDFAIMHPDLQAQYPDIRSYAGISMDQAGGSIFFDVTPKGFHSMTLHTPNGSVFIDPYSKADDQHYLVYYKKDFVKAEADRMKCLVSDDPFEATEKNPIGQGAEMPATNCTKRREYRLAMAATGEYTAFHGGTVAAGLAAINTSMTRVNGVFTNDASIKMILIANNTSIIYTNGATDPYSNNDGFAMLAENQTNVDAVIGTANYDIGHVFSTNGGGVAYTNSPCSSTLKAQGVTGTSAPIGDPFDIDYVAHEIGHQYGCSHTFASSSGFCSGNGSSGSAFEPGSGTTIMAYAGICAPQNVQNNSDPYYHARSLLQMSSFVTNAGHTCDTEISNGNNAPSVAAFTGVTFPHSTPFVLTGSATDPNGNPLTYCWEQYNNALVSPPASGNTTGPLFRSLNPVSVTYRYFPSFDNVFGNTTDTWEVLPGVARTLTFRFTARDNQAIGGCTDEKDISVAIAATGPFTLTAPNGGVSLTGNASYTVTWNVAGTTGSGINAANVDILYSTNPSDPTTYVVLLANTPNDGTQAVTMPNITSSTFRIMVRNNSTNGIFFFDISNSNNSITMSLPVEMVRFDAAKQGNAVVLDWTTALEQNNRGFAIQRSVQNSLYFETIGWVDAKQEQGEKHYSFTDQQVKAGNVYYYRLQQQDMNGEMNYSDLRSVSFEGVTRQLQIAPNPAKDYVTLTADEASYEEVFEVSVLNAGGQVVMQRNMTLNNAIATENWPSGVYMIRAVSDRKIWAGKVVK